MMKKARPYLLFFLLILLVSLCHTACAPAQEQDTMRLSYDDYVNVSDKSVEILNEGVSENGDAVITLDGDWLIATGVGSAQARIDGRVCNITVKKAKIHIIMISEAGTTILPITPVW